MTTSLPPHAVRKLLALGAPLAGEGAGETEPGAPGELVGAVVLERYEIVRELGRGGMGVVYEAFDRELRRRVALKVLSDRAGLGAAARERFAREALAAAKLSHPHVAAVYDASERAIAMQLVDGVTLAELEGAGARTLAALVRDAALAVHYAHGQGLVHRDIKPANLMVEGAGTERPHIYVTDFGLAKETDFDSDLSMSGHVLGSPRFLSPEQAAGRNRSIDARSDVYSLGATLYACLAGRAPFDGDDVYEILRRTIEDEPRELRSAAPHVDRDLATIVMKCLVKEPERRYQSALELASDLDRWLGGQPVHARPLSFAYRLRKLVARRRGALAASVTVGLVAGLVVLALMLPRAWRERAQRDAAERALALASRVSVCLADADAYRRAGQVQSARERLDEGIAACESFLASVDIGQVRSFLGRLLRARGRPDDALLAFDRALELEPGLDEAHLRRGLLLADRWSERAAHGESGAELAALRARAITDLEAALDARADVEPVDVLLGRGLLAWLRGDGARGESHLREVVEIDPMHVDAHLALSRLFLERGDAELARRHSVTAVDVMRGFGPAYDASAAKLGGLDEAGAPLVRIEGIAGVLVDFDRLASVARSDAAAYGSRGQGALREAARRLAAGDPASALAGLERARADFEEVTRLEPARAAGWTNRGVVGLALARALGDAGRSVDAAAARRRALDDLDRALELAPGDPAALLDRALAHRRAAELHALGRRAAEREAALAAAHADFDAARASAAQLAPDARRVLEQALDEALAAAR